MRLDLFLRFGGGANLPSIARAMVCGFGIMSAKKRHFPVLSRSIWPSATRSTGSE
jgi:hypothetical protein